MGNGITKGGFEKLEILQMKNIVIEIKNSLNDSIINENICIYYIHTHMNIYIFFGRRYQRFHRKCSIERSRDK